MGDKPTYVTRPFLPPLEEFLPYLEQIWESRWLTNAGPFHHQLEAALAEFLGVKHLALFTNGTIALVTALQALRVTGEVITTPYSFVATAHSLLWNNIRPVFVDIDPLTCNLDPQRVEAAITPQTTAILPVHCYGTPCDVAGLQRLADVYGLKVIYDAAHAFGVRDRSQSILQYRGSLDPELPRNEGLPHVRRRRDRLSGREDKTADRLSEEFRFRRRGDHRRGRHQRKDE